MPAQNRTTLKSYFNSGDLITEANLADLIDSCHNLTDDFPVRLPTISFANVSTIMTANTRYAGSISGFTGSRTYSVPAGTAGDVIELQLTTGNATHALIIAGDAGVSVNGGTAGGEWSRLFIDNEFVRLRCHAANDWRVEVDGRIPMRGQLIATSSSSVSSGTWTTILYNSEWSNSNIASHANERFTARRACRARGILRWFSETASTQAILAVTRNGFTVGSPEARFHQGSFAPSTGLAIQSGGVLPWETESALAAGDTVGSIVIAAASLTATSLSFNRPLFTFEEILI